MKKIWRPGLADSWAGCPSRFGLQNHCVTTTLIRRDQASTPQNVTCRGSRIIHEISSWLWAQRSYKGKYFCSLCEEAHAPNEEKRIVAVFSPSASCHYRVGEREGAMGGIPWGNANRIANYLAPPPPPPRELRIASHYHKGTTSQDFLLKSLGQEIEFKRLYKSFAIVTRSCKKNPKKFGSGDIILKII